MPIDWTQVTLAAVNRLPQIITAVFSGIAAVSGMWGWRHSKRARRVSEHTDATVRKLALDVDGKMTALLVAQKAVGIVQGMKDEKKDTRDLVATAIKATKEPPEEK